MASNKEQADVVVIGAGPAGYVCAIRLAQLGKKVTVIDKGMIGGVCLNIGCIPSKALIYAGTMLEKSKHLDEIGISFSGTKLDMAKLIGWKEKVVKQLTDGVSGLLKANGCRVVVGEARFVGPRELEVTTKEGKQGITFNQCVVATGSRAAGLRGFDVDQKSILDSTGALAQTKVPKSLLCIGGGYIGLELGTFYSKIGTQVTVVEASDSLLSGVDPDLTRVVQKSLKKRGVEVLLKTFAGNPQKTASGVEVEFSGETKRKAIFEKILVTIGRTPNTEKLDLEAAGLRPDEHGFIHVNGQRQTSVPGIYAIGDVAGQPLLAHKGSKEGMVCAEAIAGHRVVFDVAAMPAVIFTDPEIATVGMTEKEARSKEIPIDVASFPFAANGRALSVQESDGFIKMIGHQKTGQLLGVHIVGPEASNLIAEATLAIEMGAQVEDLALTVHAHPTLPETMMEAAEATLGHAIHIFQRKAKPQTKAQPQASP